jgi:hypothetical protein
MLSPRQAQLAFVPLMVTVMSAVISLAMTALHGGFARAGVAAGLQTWLGNWAMAFVVALPVAWVAVPAVRGLLARLTDAAPAARELGSMG